MIISGKLAEKSEHTVSATSPMVPERDFQKYVTH